MDQRGRTDTVQRALLHIHTRRSYDSWVRPESIAARCVTLGIDVVCVTDHDTIAGSLEVQRALRGTHVQAVIGAEYLTGCGDLIGLFLQKEAAERNAMGLIEEIHAQGGIAILPHPFHAHNLTEEVLRTVDGIEVFNSRCTAEQNARALVLAAKLGKPMFAGADAHFLRELDQASMTFSAPGPLTPESMITAARTWSGRAARPSAVRFSQAIKSARAGHWDRAALSALAGCKRRLTEAPPGPLVQGSSPSCMEPCRRGVAG
jgi:predicted metal-dependent phosphoesterase TrpH